MEPRESKVAGLGFGSQMQVLWETVAPFPPVSSCLLRLKSFAGVLQMSLFRLFNPHKDACSFTEFSSLFSLKFNEIHAVCMMKLYNFWVCASVLLLETALLCY